MIHMVTVFPRVRSGIVGESTNDEAYGVLMGEDRLVRDIMTQKTFAVRSSMLLKEANETIRNRNVHTLVVYQGEEPVIALTEPDLAGDIITCENASGLITLQDIMKNRVAVRCLEDTILADAIPAMIEHRAAHVPVLEAKGGLVGTLSLVDAIGALSPSAAEKWLAKMRGWSVTPPPSK